MGFSGDEGCVPFLITMIMLDGCGWGPVATRLQPCPHVHSPIRGRLPSLRNYFSTGGVEGALLIFACAMGDQRSAFVIDSCAYELSGGTSCRSRMSSPPRSRRLSRMHMHGFARQLRARAKSAGSTPSSAGRATNHVLYASSCSATDRDRASTQPAQRPRTPHRLASWTRPLDWTLQPCG